ncbi:MAG: ZIP family metal transporter [Verrucomicrobiota bacterium]|jgi:zinc and cadmium transporter
MKGVSLSAGALLVIYGLLVALASLSGGWVLLAMRLTHARLQMAVSFVAGLMLGMALLHFIPHASEQYHSLEGVLRWCLGGFLAMFFLERFLPHHHHDLPDQPEGLVESGREPEAARGAEGRHAHAHWAAVAAAKPANGLSWVGTTLGMSLHSLMDGVALAAAVVAESRGQGGVVVGLGTALVIMLHKPFDAMAISTMMAASGCSRFARQLLNGLFALATPLGMALFYLGASHLAHMDPAFLGGALAFCAGTFLCIACADLLPELQFHSHDRLKLSLALAAGLGITVVLGQVE